MWARLARPEGPKSKHLPYHQTTENGRRTSFRNMATLKIAKAQQNISNYGPLHAAILKSLVYKNV
jgi:hypothetical protein